MLGPFMGVFCKYFSQERNNALPSSRTKLRVNNLAVANLYSYSEPIVEIVFPGPEKNLVFKRKKTIHMDFIAFFLWVFHQ